MIIVSLYFICFDANRTNDKLKLIRTTIRTNNAIQYISSKIKTIRNLIIPDVNDSIIQCIDIMKKHQNLEVESTVL